ncbi:MAG: radical SAM protein [Clostridiaceae bacterium]|jgi:MoaA/NifB/PqqE/SkfB family radical SAM enzyme|nr:radical SAM protein [Clostridiaceae bacterium]
MVDLSKLFDVGRNLYAYHSYKRNDGLASIPLRYFFELTYRCNLQCPYCYVGCERKKDELSTEEWKKVVEQIPWYSFVTLVGGEPLIRTDFIDILMMTAQKTKGKLNVVSNGVLINDEIIDAFIKSKMMLLSVSLDGYGTNHDKNRNKEGIFEKINNNFEKMNSRSKRPMIDIKTIVLENNLDDIVKLYKYCNEMKFNFLSISFLRNNNLKQNAVLFDRFVPEFNENYPIQKYFDMEHFKEVYNELMSLKKKSNVQIRFSPKFEYSKNPLNKIEEFFNTPSEKPIQDIYKPCMYPFSNMMINPQGDIYPCLSEKVGNIREMSIKEAYNQPNFRCFRKNLKASKLFGACQMCCELEVK